MRFSITDFFGGDRDRAAIFLAIDTPLPSQHQKLESLLETFRKRAAPIRSIVAVGCHQILGITGRDSAGTFAREVVRLRPVADEGSPSASVTAVLTPVTEQSRDGESRYALESLALQARELSGLVSGDDLLLLPADLLREMMTSPADHFSFRALAALLPKSHAKGRDGNSWRLRRDLFDRGLICIGSVDVEGTKALCFQASEGVRSFDNLDVESRGHISMSGLTERGLFGNQLFRYACVKLYALRHNLTPLFPDWQGRQLFALEDKSCVGLTFPKLEYPAFADNDREFWDADDPPINIDLDGYFQEIPECWRNHRPLLRHMFKLAPKLRHSIEAWQRDVTAGGRRTLVAIHVRRGDYCNRHNRTVPWFRTVPEQWYLAWLRSIWPLLREPLLFIGTDAPNAIRPFFREFETISQDGGPVAEGLPDYVRDFEILRRADCLAICNSSFSRMAAILAPSTQKCFLPSFQTECFEPYEPWIDPNFWPRFADSRPHPNVLGTSPERLSAVANHRHGFNSSPGTSTIFFDVSDLLLYLLHHTTLSGIQRVQCEILRNLLDIPPPQPVRLAVLNGSGGLCTIETSGLLDVIEALRSGGGSQAKINSPLRALLDGAVPCTVRPGDVFLSIGGFWNTSGMGTLLRDLKNSGVVIGVFIHDLMPIAAPEYFEVPSTTIFVKAVVEALNFADFVLTTSRYNEATLSRHIASAKLDPLPVRVVPLGHELRAAPTESKISKLVAGLMDADYVLCVGTLEVRKNPGYLFNIWKMMVASGRSDIPQLVFVGRKGWLVQDFIDQLKACNYLGGKVLILHNVTDVELGWLYRRCMLTMFPSFLEGWGLPVGESLAHGKICICSDAGGIPEVGGELADYVDPHNPRDGLRVLLRYLDDPELHRTRELEIAGNFAMRSWRKAAEDFLKSTQGLLRQATPLEGEAAMLLPQSRYLPISSGRPATLMDQMDGSFSAELICISGWHPPTISGIRPAQPDAMIRFRADAPVGTKINLTLKLVAHGRVFRVRICSPSGAETEVSVASGCERVAVLPCVVEAGQLVTVHLLSIGVTLAEEPGQFYWMLKGILYFDPKSRAAEALNKFKDGPDAHDRATQPSPSPVSGQSSDRDRILLRPASMDESWRTPSFREFLHGADCYWPADFKGNRDAPIFADEADEQAFYNGCGKDAQPPEVGRVTESIKLIRRSNQFVSTSRFSEGLVFDRLGAWRALGHLERAPSHTAPWVSRSADSLWVPEEKLKTAPYYEGSFLLFYNGNLHNYYHWLVEGLLSLDILSYALGLDSSLKIALPKSIDINALIDHRESFRAVGLDGYEAVEIPASLIRVREAVWVDDDSITNMPAIYLKSFQRRVAALYPDITNSRPRRRLLVARNGLTRTIHNLEQVQDCLSKYDFETVYLEGMSMKDQILLFQSAEFIIGAHGAGLANLLFCEPGTKVIELMPSVEMRPFFWLISQKLGLVHGVQFCAPVSGEDFQSAIVADIGKLQTLIDKVDAHLSRSPKEKIRKVRRKARADRRVTS